MPATRSTTTLLTTTLLMVTPLLSQATAPVGDPDRDGDGLSDFQEIHKYRTDPAKRDSDGDGRSDGDWLERREYTYSIRTVIQVMPTYDKATLNDDYQDCRVLHGCAEYIELEVVHYPLNTCAQTIRGRVDWRKAAVAKAAFVAPGTTTNWDQAMRTDLLRRLRAAGIHVDRLSDRAIVEKVADWALQHARSLDKTCVWAVVFAGGQPVVPAALAAKFRSNKGDSSWSQAQQFDRELYGKGMYEHRTRGTCTTSANYLATVLRAVGIPTRSIVTIPLIDGSDPRNVEMLENRITHHAVRRDILRGVKRLKGSFAAHTFNEVWIDGRWRRLNYNRLGQNILDPVYLGLMTHVHTFLDLADAGLGSGWGLGRQRPSDVFRHANPYTALTISDLFGAHSKISNPEVDGGEPSTLTISKAYWFESDARPPGIGADWPRAQDKSHGHLLVHVIESGIDFGMLHGKVSKRFVLRAKGAEDVEVQSWACIWPDRGGNGAEFYLRVPSEELAKLKRGRRYRLLPTGQHPKYQWRIADVFVTK